MKTNYEKASMLDMIFEHRNKTYGAYALRKNYSKTISEALLITLSAIVLLGFGKFLSAKFKSHPKTLSGPIVVVQPIPEVKFETPIAKPETPPAPPQLQGRPTRQNTEISVIADNNQVDSVPPAAQMNNTAPGLTTNSNGEPTGVPDGTGTALQTTHAPPVDNQIHEGIIEVMPEFPGGEMKLREFLAKNTRYPEYELELGIEGKAYAKFVVNADGSVSGAELIRTVSRGFGKEAVRVVSILPDFKPGIQGGRPVRVQLVLPFNFVLND